MLSESSLNEADTAVIEEAKSTFEKACTQQLTMTDSKPNTFSLELGALVPDWNSSVISYSNDGKRQSVDVKLKESTYRYRAYQTGKDEDDVRIVRFDQKLIIVKDLESEKSSCYVLFYIPTNDYARKNKGILTNQTDNFSLPQDFSGLKMWTRLDGTVARINRYSGGTMTGTISFIGRNRVLHYSAKMKSLGYMLQNLTIQKGIPKTKGGQTPSSPEDEEGRLWIEMGYTFKDGQWYDPQGNLVLDGSSCVADKPEKPNDEPWPEPEEDEDPEFNHDEIDPGDDNHAGGDGPDPYEKPDPEPEPEDTTLVGAILERVTVCDGLPESVKENLKETLTSLIESSDPIKIKVFNTLNISKLNISIVSIPTKLDKNGNLVTLDPGHYNKPDIRRNLNTGALRYDHSDIQLMASKLGVIDGVFEEFFHSYQYQCNPEWTSGDVEWEARVLATEYLLHSPGYGPSTAEDLIHNYYLNPNDATFALARDAAYEIFEIYREYFDKMTPDLSPIDRIRHLYEK